jgi:hypothetical protein
MAFSSARRTDNKKKKKTIAATMRPRVLFLLCRFRSNALMVFTDCMYVESSDYVNRFYVQEPTKQ